MPEEITPGQILEALNDKADRDLSNITVGGGVDYVIDYQRPTAENNYTWYRKYASGWVEQGGYASNFAWTGSGNTKAVTLPIAMNSVNYTVCATMSNSTANWNYPGCMGYAASSTSIIIGVATGGSDQGTVHKIYWQVSGIAA